APRLAERGRGGPRPPVEVSELVEGSRHRELKRLEIEAVEPPTTKTGAALFEQPTRPGQIAVGQVLVAHGHLDEPLQRLAIVFARVAPGGLEKLVDLEVEMRVEERGRPGEGAGAGAGA